MRTKNGFRKVVHRAAGRVAAGRGGRCKTKKKNLITFDNSKKGEEVLFSKEARLVVS